MNYEQTMLAVKDYHSSIDLPVRYYGWKLLFCSSDMSSRIGFVVVLQGQQLGSRKWRNKAVATKTRCISFRDGIHSTTAGNSSGHSQQILFTRQRVSAEL